MGGRGEALVDLPAALVGRVPRPTSVMRELIAVSGETGAASREAAPSSLTAMRNAAVNACENRLHPLSAQDFGPIDGAGFSGGRHLR